MEPFVGGGSVFTNAEFRYNLLNIDINGDLINFYPDVRLKDIVFTLSYQFSKLQQR
uniref:DNA adenine methylase n=1 Tax=Salmonella sp. TaxID=599 RepID=UPI0039950595